MSLDIHEFERVLGHRYRKTAYGVRFLDPGTRSVVLKFERAVREYSLNEDLEKTRERYVRAKRALVRRILRITGEIPHDTRGRRREPR